MNFYSSNNNNLIDPNDNSYNNSALNTVRHNSEKNSDKIFRINRGSSKNDETSTSAVKIHKNLNIVTDGKISIPITKKSMIGNNTTPTGASGFTNGFFPFNKNGMIMKQQPQKVLNIGIVKDKSSNSFNFNMEKKSIEDSKVVRKNSGNYDLSETGNFVYNTNHRPDYNSIGIAKEDNLGSQLSSAMITKKSLNIKNLP